MQPLSGSPQDFSRKQMRNRSRTTESNVQSRSWLVNIDTLQDKKLTPPSLSIIDFNNLTRGGLDTAKSNINKESNKTKSKKVYHHRRARKCLSAVNINTLLTDSD